MKANLKGVFVCSVAIALNAAATAPIITSQPQSVTVNNASTAYFSVTADNAASYQWLFGTNVLSGATNTTLVLDDVVSNQMGAYSVTVTSPTGESSNSQPAQLTIMPGTIVQFSLSTYADGSSSNILVQLFDHDKPATVENFVHYITSGAFSNMFFERDVTNFVLQGGDYVTFDRGTNGLNGDSVSGGTNIFPSQLNSEFAVGPLLHNSFGTIAMALAAGNPNSATSGFFFNLVDNSATLDPQDFTVFGRILSGSNVLQYFNTLRAPSNGIFDINFSLPTVPVNYDGTNQPTDANLFYCDFKIETPLLIDSRSPTVAISFPAPNTAFTNGGDLTVTGTASDNIGLAEVYCVLTSTSGVYGNASLTNVATGTTAWSVDLGTNPPGAYQLMAYAQDGAGNLSAPATLYFTNLTPFTIVTNVGGQLTTNKQYGVPGQQYSVTAAPPESGDLFEYWNNQGVLSLDPVQTFTLETNMTLTVTFVSNSLPAGLEITNPAESAVVQSSNGTLVIDGVLPAATRVTQVTCQLFFQSNAMTAPLAASLNDLGWSVPVSGLLNGPYTIVAVAVDSLGREGLATRDFVAQVPAPPVITSQTHSFTVNTGSSAYLSVTATNAASYQWYFRGKTIDGATNSTLVLENVATNQAGAYKAVITSPLGNTATTQPVQLTVETGTILQLTMSGYSAGGTSNVVVELFDHDKPGTVQNFLHYFVSGAFTNLFWTRCVPGFVLQGGDFSSVDRTNGAPPNLNSIKSTYTDNLSFTPPFPFQVDNEFGAGPLLHNTFGTIAMAKTAGDPNSATSTFFFNLADNSTNLDNQNGGFTVFGRILSGSNVLDYFNTFKMPTIYDQIPAGGSPSNGLFNSGSAPFTTVPVNYFGLNDPGNSNFFYVDFSFPTPPIIDTNPPTVAALIPANGSTVTNSHVIISGVAADDFGLARVVCSLSSPGYNGGSEFSPDANGTTNWSYDFGELAPGTYTVAATAQDGAGNLSTREVTSFVVNRYPFNADVVGPGTLSTNLTEANTTVGSSYVIKAIPGKGALFLNWAGGGTVSINPVVSFVMRNDLTLTATFVPNTLPGGISFSYPAPNGKVPTNNFTLTGKVAKNSGMTTITAQIFSKADSSSVTDPMVATGSSTWSIPSVKLAPGSYIVQALASNALGATTVITEDFTVLAPLSVTITGSGTTSLTNGTYLQIGTKYTIKATPKPGQLFYCWNEHAGLDVSPTTTFTMTNGFAVTATFITNSLPRAASFSYPTANSVVLTNTFILTGTVSASLDKPQVMCQLFSGSLQASSKMYATVTGDAWSVPLSKLTQGSYTVVAIASDSTGAQTLISENFRINLFANAAGTYYGVFFTTNIATNTAGFFRLNLSGSGIMTGILQFPIHTYSIYYPINSSGVAQLSGQGFNGTTIYFGVEFDLVNGTDAVTGYVYSLGNDATFTGHRAARQLPTNTVVGKYVLNMETTTNYGNAGPTNDGFASLSIANTGSLTLGGTLADNSTFSEAAVVSKDGVWPVYATLYGGHGMLIGQETNVIGPSGVPGSIGTVYWVKAPTKDTYFTNGLNLQAAVTGTNYAAPAPGTQYQVVFGGGTLTPPLSNTLNVNQAGQFVPAPGASDKLTISLSASGSISGKIFNPATGKTLQIHGAFSSPTVGGFGFVLDTDGLTDPFQITLVP